MHVCDSARYDNHAAVLVAEGFPLEGGPGHALRIFSIPSSATVTMRGSEQVSRSHSGLMAPAFTKYLIWSWRPPEVALLMAHAASFLMSNSASPSMCTSGTTSSASITACRHRHGWPPQPVALTLSDSDLPYQLFRSIATTIMPARSWEEILRSMLILLIVLTPQRNDFEPRKGS